jgi:hypothetical protein
MNAINNEIQAIPLGLLNTLKMELGLSEKNINTLTPQDKVRLGSTLVILLI